jgi:hypothetical protein
LDRHTELAGLRITGDDRIGGGESVEVRFQVAPIFAQSR